MHQEYLSVRLWSKTVTLLARQEGVEQSSMGKNSDIQTQALAFIYLWDFFILLSPQYPCLQRALSLHIDSREVCHLCALF